MFTRGDLEVHAHAREEPSVDTLLTHYIKSLIAERTTLRPGTAQAALPRGTFDIIRLVVAAGQRALFRLTQNTLLMAARVYPIVAELRDVSQLQHSPCAFGA